MNSAKAIFSFSSLLLALAGYITPPVWSSMTRNPPPRPVLVAVVSGEGEGEMNMDAVVMIEAGKFKAPFDENSEAAQQEFAREYFKPGREYRLTFGGGEVGTATVQKFATGCNNIHASVAVESFAKIRGQVKALATNSDSLGKRTSARRAPSDSERAAVMDLVKKIYTLHGVSGSQYRSLKVTNLAATDLDGDGRYEMIGSFALALKTKAERDLFLIAEAQGAGMRAGLAKFQAYQPPAEGFLSSIDFVDQLDLDGDGTGEVFAVQGGFDAYGYLIFKRSGDRWRQVYSAMGDAC